MNKATLLTILAFTGAAFFGQPRTAQAGSPYDFSFTAPGGSIPDDSYRVFPLTMNPSVGFIDSIELVITGLSHDSPMDLDVLLINPFGLAIDVMSDLGGMTSVSNLDMVFRDGAAGLPGSPLTSGDFRPEGLVNGDDAGMATFTGKGGGTDAWVLVVIDDAVGDMGSFESFTLRGTVPEPMTLSLLLVGGLATLRRKRRPIA
jgi:hypothetical protein